MKKAAFMDAEEMLQHVLNTQPHLIQPHEMGATAGKAIAEFCEAFILRYAEFSDRRKGLIQPPTS